MKLRMGRDQNQPTKLYVLECAGKVKIGIAADVTERVAHLQMACPVKITIAHERQFPTRTLARLAERSLHLRHSDARLWGEWFEMDVADAVAAVVAVEEQAEPVRIPAPRKAAPPEPVVRTVAPRKPRHVPANEGAYRPTWDDYEAMTDDVWLDHMRPAAAALDFTLPYDERRALVAAMQADLAARYAA